jgi:5'-phosphate synthase pdxT subunit
VRVGVLALQGGYDPHYRVLSGFDGVQAVLIRTLDELNSVQALVIPGGESTTIGKLLVLQGLLDPLRALVETGLPVLGTCAGLILLAKEVMGKEQPLLGLLDLSVERNAYGRQSESFEAQVDVDPSVSASGTVPALFIRAPMVVRLGADVQVLGRHEGKPVLVRQRNVLAASFHPELTGSDLVHRYFLSMV